MYSCDSADNKVEAKNYTVGGTIKGAAGKLVFLTDKAFYNESHPRDSVVADASGHFLFKGTLTEPSYYALSVQDVQGIVDLILENDSITVEGSVDSLWTAKVEGSKENDIHKEFIPFTGYFANQERFNAIEAAYDSASKAGDTTALARMEREKKELSVSFKAAVKRFINKYPISVTAVNNLVYFLDDDDLRQADSMLQGFEKSSIGNHKQVQYFRKLIDRKKSLSIGSIAPDFEQPDSTGRVIKLSSLRNNFVLVDFWASWCSPCRQENPNLVRIFNRFKHKGFTILSVSLDDDRTKWLRAVHKDQMQQWLNVGDLKGWSNAAAVQYGIDGIPSSLLLDPTGTIIAKNLRGEALEKKVASVYR